MADEPEIVPIDTGADTAPPEMEHVDTVVDVKDADKHPDDDFDPASWLEQDEPDDEPEGDH